MIIIFFLFVFLHEYRIFNSNMTMETLNKLYAYTHSSEPLESFLILLISRIYMQIRPPSPPPQDHLTITSTDKCLCDAQ